MIEYDQGPFNGLKEPAEHQSSNSLLIGLLSGASSQEGFSSMLLGKCKSCGDVASRVVFGDESDVFDMADMAQQLERNGRIVDQEDHPSFTDWKWCECTELNQAT